MADQARPKFAYFDGKIVPIDEAKVSVMTHGLNYGTGVFGGLRGYWNAEESQLYIFRPLDHFKRFIQSASLMRINLDHTPQSLTDILMELLREEGFQSNVYIRPLAYKSLEGIGVRLHDIP
ncbi:MAG: branched chain amino acid aminotransferase, partial [bacterium]|nr:branched chain amino acid aminotransferase [bacterium]